MRRNDLESGLTILSKHLDLLGSFLSLFSKSLPAPFLYDSGLQHFGFRYGKPGQRHFCLLKAVRAVSALNACVELVRSGYTQELYVMLRTVVEFKSHIEYILSAETGDEKLKADVERHIQDYFSDFRRNSPADFKRPKIRQGVVHESVGNMYSSDIKKSDDGRFTNSVPSQLLSNIYLNFSNYVHARYPEVMDMFGGIPPEFHLRGMSGTSKDDENYQMLEVTVASLSTTLRMVVQKLTLQDLLEKDQELKSWFRGKNDSI